MPREEVRLRVVVALQLWGAAGFGLTHSPGRPWASRRKKQETKKEFSSVRLGRGGARGVDKIFPSHPAPC